jgi:pyridoxine/pyridoxamine 5'-phosphate oxidase
VFRPTPARSAIASIVAAWKPSSASRSSAACVIASSVVGRRGRPGRRLAFVFEPGTGGTVHYENGCSRNSRDAKETVRSSVVTLWLIAALLVELELILWMFDRMYS